ncbi:hypothetical protein Lal_00032155 [Lupinus albus]|nr:hypothetical protein Lal_00032155 [Lupinus albus]
MYEVTEELKRSMLNDTCSAYEPENEEQAHISIMASHHSDNEEISETKPCSSSELQMGFNDLHDEYDTLRVACNLWYLDSGCSKHITGNKNKFSFLTPRDKGYVTYGDNNKGRILGVGNSPEEWGILPDSRLSERTSPKREDLCFEIGKFSESLPSEEWVA